jgi:ribosome maturation factor RimP
MVSENGFDLYNLAFVVENNINYLRVTISHPDRAVTLDDCEKISRSIDKFLDGRNLISFPYTLEVQSKGTESEVKNPSEYSFTLSKLGLVVKT